MFGHTRFRWLVSGIGVIGMVAILWANVRGGGQHIFSLNDIVFGLVAVLLIIFGVFNTQSKTGRVGIAAAMAVTSCLVTLIAIELILWAMSNEDREVRYRTFVPAEADDPTANYETIEQEMVARTPIIQNVGPPVTYRDDFKQSNRMTWDQNNS